MNKQGDRFGLEEKIGQLLFWGVSEYVPSDALREQICRYGLGGVVLFPRRAASPAEISRFCAELQAMSLDKWGVPLLIAIDQEGGRVARLKEGFTPLPPMAGLGACGKPELAHALGRLIGRELSSVGINMNFSPALDVDSCPHNPIIGDRAISSDPCVAADLGCAIIDGLREGGVIPVGKHFPGHGDTGQDSHIELPIVRQPVEALEERELHPFRAAVSRGLPALMTAHVLYPAWDKDHPATLSPYILQKLLRERMQFRGLIISDDMVMKAIDQERLGESAAAAVRAGVDMLIVSRNEAVQQQVFNALVSAAETGELPSMRLDEAARHISELKSRLTPQVTPDPSAWKRLACPEHKDIVNRIKEG